MWEALLLLAGLYTTGPILAVASPPPMPAVIGLIVCKTRPATGPADQNSNRTHYENLEWDTTGATMHCRLITTQVMDQAEANGADPQPFNMWRCQRSGMMLGPQWDEHNKSSKYRFWKVACPVPIVVEDMDGNAYLKDWKLPDCGADRSVIVCETDTEI